MDFHLLLDLDRLQGKRLVTTRMLQTLGKTDRRKVVCASHLPPRNTSICYSEEEMRQGCIPGHIHLCLEVGTDIIRHVILP